MTMWDWLMIALGGAWLIGTPTAVFLWERAETRAENAADAAELAAEDDFVEWAAELDDTVELP